MASHYPGDRALVKAKTAGGRFFALGLNSQNFFGYDRTRMDPLLVQGRTIGPSELHWIRELMSAHPQWGRWHLSIHIAQQWNWRNAG